MTRDARIFAFLVVLLVTMAVTPGDLLLPGLSGAQELADVSVTRLQRDIAANSERIDFLGHEIDDAGRRERQLTAEIAATEIRLAATREQADAARTAIRERAVALYVGRRSETDPIVSLRRVADAASAQRYGDGLAERDDDMLGHLADIAAALEADTERLLAARDDVVSQRDRAVAARAALADVLVRQRRLLAALDVIPLMGVAQLSARQIVDWFDSTGMGYRLSGGTSMRELAQTFVEEGAAEGVRGDVAFAQSVLETGYFRWALDNNYAGLGACDSCAGEPAFPSPRDGVRAQIQHLKNYGDPDSAASGLAHAPSPTWYGADPAQAARNFDTFFAKGRAQTWQSMGGGNWATDPNYATKVIGIYVRMVVFAADHG